MAVSKMIDRGWLREVEANVRRGEPLWRETGDGHGTTLVVTEAGLLTIGIQPMVVKAKTDLPNDAAETLKPKPPTQRAGTKQAMLITMLQAPAGATMEEVVAATGWHDHSARGLISGGLKKKLGLPITSEKVQGRGTVYKLEAA